MDSKRNKCTKKTYRNKEAKVQHHETGPEVFVLPPDILQKLGINLEKVDSNKKKPANDSAVPEVNNAKKVYSPQHPVIGKEIQDPQGNVSIRDVSLVKTAELMKKSVFLSPTFAPVTTNSSELELLALYNKTITPTLNGHESKTTDIVQCCDELNNSRGHLSVSSTLTIPRNLTVNDSPNEKFVPIDTAVESIEAPSTELPEELEGIQTDDHLDEAYLSDCSNNNFELVENVKPSIETPVNCKKITIISEEIITPCLADYAKSKKSEMSNSLSLACQDSKGSSVFGATLQTSSHVIQNNFVTKTKISPMHQTPEYRSKIKKDKRKVEEADFHNDYLSDCIDISVTDIEEHLKQNEEVLQEFANEIISNDSSDIISKIKRSEQLCEDSNMNDIINVVDRDVLCVSHYRNDQIMENGNDLSYYINCNNKTSCTEIIDNVISIESDGLISGIIQNTDNNILSVISNSEETNFIGSKLDLDSKTENSMDGPSTTNKLPTTQSNMIASCMINTIKNKGKSKEETIAENSVNNLHDKVETISSYLKQCLYKMKTKSLTKVKETKQSYPRKLKRKDLKSNQGVEKPGGTQYTQSQLSTHKKPTKTYRKATNITVPKANLRTYSRNSEHSNPNPDMTSKLQIDEITPILISDTTSNKNFCLCYDFGRMDFYDRDTPYEHIHFWEQRVLNIVPDLVFSVFNDDADCSISKFDKCSPILANFQEHETQKTELATCNICWNSIESENEIFNVKQCVSNLEKVQPETIAFSRNVSQVSDTTHNKSELDTSKLELPCTKYAESENHLQINSKYISTDIETNVDAIFTEENSLPINESNDDAINQNEEVDDDEIVVIQIQDNLESTLVEETKNVAKDISLNEEVHSNIKNKPQENTECTQNLKRFISDKEINQEDETGKTPGNKNKKNKKSSEPARKSRRFTLEHEIEDDHVQSPKSEKKKPKKRRRSSMQKGSDEEPLSVKKSRKEKSLDTDSSKYSTAFKNNVEVAVSKSGTEESKETDKVQCGVCSQIVNESEWFQHMGKEHSYIAWKLGEPAVDMDDEEQFETHLKEIVKQTTGLVCSKCGLIRKYVKPYLKHFNQCNEDGNVTIKLENVSLDFHDNAEISANNEELINCGVCNKEVQSENWIKHIQMAHDYLAWKQGETLDLDNPDAVNDHLMSILKSEGELVCSKCGLRQKYPKVYLDHIQVCSSERIITEGSCDVTTSSANKETVVCAVCNDEVNAKQWIVHNMKKHYNLAWIRGEPPVVATSLNIIEKLLKEYRNKYKKLVCNVCGISRISYMGFYAHILVCGKSEEKIEKFKILCNICNKKYMFLYQKQHLTAHREQEIAKERKLQAEVKKATQLVEQNAEAAPSGRRKAAEKARTVIEKYNENTTATYKCEECSFSSDHKKEFNKHKCGVVAADSDSQPSSASESEDSHDDVDSNVSDDEEENITEKKKKKLIAQSPIAKSKVLPFLAAKPKKYIERSGEEYYKTYLSSEGLFSGWRNMALEEVSDQEMASYMPPLKESCKVRISNANHEGEWKTYQQFEAKEAKGASTLFVGASIQCVAWAPPQAIDLAVSREESCFLAVSIHRGPDAPRFSADKTHSHPALIQIWEFGNFKSLPKFVFGLVHDYGTVWAMDWCPSGARDAPDSDSPRLGLLAAACSDGIVHIYSVPYPPSIENSGKLFFRINQVAELRISSTSDRKLYQATAVRWCQQIGHAVIFVGYSDGTTAFYDLNTESPLLRTTENGVTILYPYYDERSHTSCVTDVSTFPCGARAGATISGAPSGVRVTSSPAARPRRRATHHAATTADFEPLFPHAIFTTDSSTLLASPPELDWAGAGQRLGSLGAAAGCARCGRCLAYAAPHLRTLRPHPAYLDTKKQCFGALDMISFGKKRKKPLKDDNLATIVEPTTYEEAIKKYGVEFRIDKDLKLINSRQRVMYAERFPLCNPVSMAFCPAPAHHDQVAIATHSGVIFVTLVRL